MKLSSEIPYQGKVKITVVYKNGSQRELVCMNEAMPRLSEMFAKTLCGYNVNEYIPRYLSIEQNDKSLLINPVLLTGISYNKNNDDDTYYASFDATILYSNVVALIPTASPIYLYLLDQDTNKLCRFRLVSSEGADITDISTIITEGSNLIVNWRMILVSFKEETVTNA